MRLVDRIRHLAAHRDVRRSAANAFWLATEAAIRIAVGFFIGLWIARYLGPESYGRLQYARSWVGIFGALAWLGTGEAVVHDFVRGRYTAGEVLGNVFLIRLVGSLVAGALAIGLGALIALDGSVMALIWILCLALPLANAPAGVWLLLQAKTRIRPAAMGRALAILSGGVLSISLILGNATVLAFAWVPVAEAVLLCAALFTIYRWQGGHFAEWRVSRQSMTGILARGIPILLYDLVASLNMRVDQLMLGWLTDFHQVGVYAAATRFSEIWWTIPPILMSSLAPRFIFSADLGDRARRNVEWMSAGLLLAAVLPSVGALLVGRPLIGSLLGAKYLEGVPVLVIHVWTAVFLFFDAPVGEYLIATHRQSILVAKSLGALVIHASLNLVLIPRHGAVGAAISALIAYFWMGCLFYMVYPGLRDVARLQRHAIYHLFWGWWHPRRIAS